MKAFLNQFILALVIVAVAGIAAAQEQVRLPDLGGTATRVLSPEEERTFARDFERLLRSHDLLIEDPMISDYFTDLGYRLVAHSSRPSAPFHFFVIREPSFNAFAAPAGVIGLHSGMLLTARDESEVAGVIAHEIAHVTQDHLARGLENQRNVSIPTMLATLGMLAAASAAGADGETSQAILMGGMSLAQQFQVNYTRQNEAEADRIGIGLLAAAGHDPHGMTRFFERLNHHSRAMGEGPPEYLRTHPLTVNRLAEARNRAEQLDRDRSVDDSYFQFVQARLRARLADPASDTEAFFRARLDNGDRPAEAMRYGLVMLMIGDHRHDQARTELDRLLADDPDHRLYRLLEADLLMARGETDAAIDALQRLQREYPGNRLVTTQYARTLMHERDPGKARRAVELLRRYLREHPGDLHMTELYARAADRAGDPVRAGEAIAESYYMRGGVKEAIEQLESIRERDDLDYYQRARVNARLNELRAEQTRRRAGNEEQQTLPDS